MNKIENLIKVENLINKGFLINSVTEMGSGKINEDALLIGSNIFGVFDGATSLKKYFDEKGNSGGFVAAQTARDTFLERKEDLLTLTKKANELIRIKMEKANIDRTDKLNVFSTTAAVVRLNIEENSFDWVQVDDSVILVIYNNGDYKLMVENYDHDKENLILWKKLNQENNPKKVELFEEDKIKVRRNMCKTGFYGKIDGDENMINFLWSGNESLEGVNHIICMTDGMFIPNPTPEKEDDFETWTKLFLKGGLELIKTYIRDIEKTDQEFVTYPRFKVHDDMTAVAISFKSC